MVNASDDASSAADGLCQLDETAPIIGLAGYWRARGPIWHVYNVPSHHLLLIEEGDVRARTSSGEKIVATAGDVLCFRPGRRSGWGHDGVVGMYQIHLAFFPAPRQRCTPVLGELGALPVKLTLGDSFAAMRQAFERVCMELPHAGELHRLRAHAAVMEILALMAAVMARRTPAPEQMDPWYRARLRIANLVEGSINVASLAREVGVSREHFIRTFRERFGRSPKAYHESIRAIEAARLLQDPTNAVKAVAYRLGFTDPKALRRAIRRHVGITPAEFRGGKKVGTAPPAFPDDAGAANKSRLFAANCHILPPEPPPKWMTYFSDEYDVYPAVPMPRRIKRR